MTIRNLRVRGNCQIEQRPSNAALTLKDEVQRRLIDADLTGHAPGAQMFAITNLAEPGDDWIFHTPSLAESMTIVNTRHDNLIGQFSRSVRPYGTLASRMESMTIVKDSQWQEHALWRRT